MRTALREVLGIETPIVLAPINGGTRLAAAVSNAGGLGMLAASSQDAATLREQLRELRTMTSHPFAANMITAFPQQERLDVCLEEGVRIVSFFWGDPAPLMARAKKAGAQVMQTVCSAADARRAVDSGVDVVVAQGWEAGGHVQGTVATMALIPAVVDAVGRVPVVAAGGIADGRGMAAALALGAAGVWMGTRFLVAEEAAIHPDYQQRVLAAIETDTTYLENLFDVGWPNAPHRVIRNSTVANWEAAGRPASGMRPGEGEVIATSPSRGDIVRYRSFVPVADVRGDVEALSLWAGQSIGLVRTRRPAAAIVREIVDDAHAILRRLAA